MSLLIVESREEERCRAVQAAFEAGVPAVTALPALGRLDIGDVLSDEYWMVLTGLTPEEGCEGEIANGLLAVLTCCSQPGGSIPVAIVTNQDDPLLPQVHRFLSWASECFSPHPFILNEEMAWDKALQELVEEWERRKEDV